MPTSKRVKKPKIRVVKRNGRPMSLPGIWSELARKIGSVAALSAAIGKSTRQVRRIAHRQCPITGSTRIALHATAAKYGMLKAFQEWEGAGSQQTGS